MFLYESIVEDAALTWFGELGYAVGHGPRLAPGEPAAEWNSQRRGNAELTRRRGEHGGRSMKFRFASVFLFSASPRLRVNPLQP